MNFGLPRSALAMNVGVAALAAVGLTALVPASGGSGQAMLVIPILTLLLAVVLVTRTRDTIQRVRQEAGSGATIDPDTGAATATLGERVLDLEFAAAQRGRPLTIALTRIEGLSRYRAEHGGAVADQLLRHAGRTLERHRRGMHLASRHDGDEAMFLSILSGSEREGAAIYAARVRREMLRHPGLPDPAGISVGIASFDLSMRSPAELLRQAEFALDKAAAAGGKVVVVGAAGAQSPRSRA